MEKNYTRCKKCIWHNSKQRYCRQNADEESYRTKDNEDCKSFLTASKAFAQCEEEEYYVINAVAVVNLQGKIDQLEKKNRRLEKKIAELEGEKEA